MKIYEKFKIRKSKIALNFFPETKDELISIISDKVDKCKASGNDTLDLSDIDISSITNMSNLFYNIANASNNSFLKNDIKTINVTGWDTSNVKEMEFMFRGVDGIIKIIGFETWNTNNVTSFREFFCHCSELTSIDGIENFKFNNCTDIAYMFAHCNSLPESQLKAVEKWSIENGQWLSGTFIGCELLENIDLSNWKCSKIYTCHSMFKKCTLLKTIKGIDEWDMKGCTDIGSMFSNCKSLKSIGDVSKWNAGSFLNLEWLFFECTNLIVNCSSWKLRKHAKTVNAFRGTKQKNIIKFKKPV